MLFQFCEVGDQGSRRGNGKTEENMREEPKRQCKGDGSGDEGAGGGAGGGGGEIGNTKEMLVAAGGGDAAIGVYSR